MFKKIYNIKLNDGKYIKIDRKKFIRLEKRFIRKNPSMLYYTINENGQGYAIEDLRLYHLRNTLEMKEMENPIELRKLTVIGTVSTYIGRYKTIEEAKEQIPKIKWKPQIKS